MDLADAISALTDLGVLPVITLGAVIFVGQRLYKRFRS